MMRTNTRIELTDTNMDIMSKMSEGNPGALTVLLALLDNEKQIDPDSALAPFGSIFSLDTHGIYGSRIWVLYKDVCGENINAFIGILRAVQLGFLPESQLDTAIDNYGRGLNVKATLKRVKERLPAFDIGMAEDA